MTAEGTVSTPPPPAERAGARRWIRTLAPYVITVAVLAAILQRYRLRDVVAAMSEGRVAPMMAVGVGLAFSLLPLAAAWDRAVIRASIPNVARAPRYVDMFRGKAGTAVLMALGYAFGSSGYGVWIARVTGCGATVATGIILYIIASDLAAVMIVGAPGIWLGGLSPMGLMIAAPVVAAAQLALALAGPYLGRQSADPTGVLAPWRRARAGAALTSVFGRCINVTLILLATWAGAVVFGLPIPLAAMATYMPLILIVSSLPVNVAGLGPATAVWVLAFERWAPGERVIAFQLLWQLGFGAGVVVRGLPFVRRVVAEIDEGRDRVADDRERPRED